MLSFTSLTRHGSHGTDKTQTRHRHSTDTTETQHRHSTDTTETRHRHSTDTAQTQHRHDTDTTQTQHRHDTDTTQTQHRHSTDTTQTQHRHSTDTLIFVRTFVRAGTFTRSPRYVLHPARTHSCPSANLHIHTTPGHVTVFFPVM